MPQQKPRDQRAAGGAQGKGSPARKRNLDFRQDHTSHDGAGKGEKAHTVAVEQILVLVADFHVCGRLVLGPLLVHVRVQDSGHQLHEQHHADHAEGISDAVSHRRRVGAGGLDGRGQAGRAGEGPGEHSHRQIGGHADQLHNGHAGQRPRADDNHTQQNIRFRVLLKVPEKFRSGDKTYRRHETD